MVIGWGACEPYLLIVEVVVDDGDGGICVIAEAGPGTCAGDEKPAGLETPVMGLDTGRAEAGPGVILPGSGVKFGSGSDPSITTGGGTV
jgi:hypothetical protein